jgi:hypothetical protein
VFCYQAQVAMVIHTASMKTIQSIKSLSFCAIAVLFLGLDFGIAENSVNFDTEIAPLLASRCLGCHAGAEPKAGLDLSGHQAALHGGDSGRVLVPGHPGQSRLWEMVSTNEMPPEHPLSVAEKESLRQWIAVGVPWGATSVDPLRTTSESRAGYDWWALQSLEVQSPPHNPTGSWRRNSIDDFILAELQSAGLGPSSQADSRSLIRRLYFDLIGLPPTPDQVAKFENDPSDEAYLQIVNKLLDSPRYGERWGRHWLDVVRYGESNGFERNAPRRNFWYYRDWVIQALNDDMPYDEFVRMQLAGDLEKPGPQGVAAAGFLVAGIHNTIVGESLRMKKLARQDELEELVGTICQTFLGLTANCARCHDHKFDPIQQVEYYRLAAAVAGVNHGERTEPIADERRGQRATGTEDSEQVMYAVTPTDTPEATKFLDRGDIDREGEVVVPGGIAAVAGVDANFNLEANAPDSQRRRRLAAWITGENNDLFARVIVNRVWHYHFGNGLVDTPSDFGFNGGRPSHPELIDWLVVQLRASDLKLKSLHRLMVTSSTYRQASSPNSVAQAIDANNRLLWRMSPRRLEAEVVRDSMLAVAGKLNLAMGGPGFEDVTATENSGTTYYEPVDVDGDAWFRRTVYRFSPRGGRSALLDTFDCPDPSSAIPRRAVTTTPLQALSLLNNVFVLRMSTYFAERVTGRVQGDTALQVNRAWQLAIGREPNEHERQLSVELVDTHGLAELCRGLFNANEFVIID